MRFTAALILPGLLAAAARAALFPGDDPSAGGVVQERDPSSPSCPQIWYDVSKDLGEVFTSSEVEIKDKDGNGLTGRNIGLAALRLVFHDCMAEACDGSVQYELGRPENKGAQLQSALQFLIDKANHYGTSVADMIVFASHVAVRRMHGPRLTTLIGRKDSRQANPSGNIPAPTQSADQIWPMFEKHGFTQMDVAALLGSHTLARAPQLAPTKNGEGRPLDNTPYVFDENSYKLTIQYAGKKENPEGVFIIPSDKSLANFEAVGDNMRRFSDHFEEFELAFINAMKKLEDMGSNYGNRAVCDSFLDPF